MIEKEKQNYRTVLFSIIIFFLFGFPVGLIHESGHSIPCIMEGYSPRIWIDGSGFHTDCSSKPSNDLLYSALGPIFGLGVVAVPALFSKIRKRRAIMIALTVWMVDQAIKIPIEIANLKLEQYAIPLLVLQVATLIALVLLFGIRRKAGSGTLG